MAHKNKSNYSAYKERQKPGVADLPLRGTHKKPEQIYSVHEANDRLYDIFKNHNFDLVNHEQRMQLAHFYQLLMQTQENQNFTRLLKLRDIAIKHFIDSLIITKHTKLKFPLMDLGTGPGFPGLPLKIIFPKEKILLAEGVQKRVEFLKLCRAELNLENLDIVGKNISKYFYYPVNGVITRAVEDIRNTLGNVSSCLQLGGRVYFMKGPNVDPEIPMAVEHWQEFYKLVEDTAYDLPFTTHKRRLVVFEKIRHPELANEEEQDFKILEGE